MGGETPHRRLHLQVLREARSPNHLAVSRIQTEEVAHRAEGVDAVPLDERRRPRPFGVTDAGVRAVVLVLPEFLAGLAVEAEDTFGALERAERRLTHRDRLAQDAVHDEDFSAGDG